MKQFNPAIFLLLMMSFSTVVFSQELKYKVEDNKQLPDVLPVTQQTLLAIFQSKFEESISFPLTDQIAFTGSVISKVEKYSNMETVILRSVENTTYLMQLSKQTLKNNDVVFSGRILFGNEQYMFLLKRDKKNHYTLEKSKLNAILQDCSM